MALRTKPYLTMSDLQDGEEDHDKKVQDYLRREGWEYNSDNPAHIWLWSKGEFKYCTTTVALMFQSELEGERKSGEL